MVKKVGQVLGTVALAVFAFFWLGVAEWLLLAVWALPFALGCWYSMRNDESPGFLARYSLPVGAALLLPWAYVLVHLIGPDLHPIAQRLLSLPLESDPNREGGGALDGGILFLGGLISVVGTAAVLLKVGVEIHGTSPKPEPIRRREYFLTTLLLGALVSAGVSLLGFGVYGFILAIVTLIAGLFAITHDPIFLRLKSASVRRRRTEDRVQREKTVKVFPSAT